MEQACIIKARASRYLEVFRQTTKSRVAQDWSGSACWRPVVAPTPRLPQTQTLTRNHEGHICRGREGEGLELLDPVWPPPYEHKQDKLNGQSEAESTSSKRIVPSTF